MTWIPRCSSIWSGWTGLRRSDSCRRWNDGNPLSGLIRRGDAGSHCADQCWKTSGSASKRRA
jgi:hypothetical protein